MHRDGSGKKIENLEQAKAEWRAKGKSPSTYCSKKEWDETQDDIGELVLTTPDGTEIRKHASVKCTTRGGSHKIAHNRVIIGNPIKYAEWKAGCDAWKATNTKSNRLYDSWMAEWTHYPHSYLDKLLSDHSVPE